MTPFSNHTGNYNSDSIFGKRIHLCLHINVCTCLHMFAQSDAPKLKMISKNADFDLAEKGIITKLITFKNKEQVKR